MDRTSIQTRIIGVYRSRDQADKVAKNLVDRGIAREQIDIRHVDQKSQLSHQHLVLESVRDELESFFHSIFDDVDQEKIQEAYAKIHQNGEHVVSVDAHDEDQLKKIAVFMSDTYATSKKNPASESQNTAKQEGKPSEFASDSLVFTEIFGSNAKDS